jgi:hypothetical protein
MNNQIFKKKKNNKNKCLNKYIYNKKLILLLEAKFEE